MSAHAGEGSAMRPGAVILLDIESIIVGEDHRTVPDHVRRLSRSFELLDECPQLQPILVDTQRRLIDGAHRLEAAKAAGWTHIAAITVNPRTSEQRVLMRVEANRLHRITPPLELERIWRSQYEPALRQLTRDRQLRTLRRGSATPVLANTNNGRVSAAGDPRSTLVGVTTPGKPLAIDRLAKEITGLSLETLRKITEIRQIAALDTAPPAARAAARRALKRLEKPGASVSALHRSVREQLLGGETAAQAAHPADTMDTIALERTTADAAQLAQRLDGALGAQLERAALRDSGNRELLRSLRHSITHCATRIASIEERLKRRNDTTTQAHSPSTPRTTEPQRLKRAA